MRWKSSPCKGDSGSIPLRSAREQVDRTQGCNSLLDCVKWRVLFSLVVMVGGGG